jgi:hypothetical protein
VSNVRDDRENEAAAVNVPATDPVGVPGDTESLQMKSNRDCSAANSQPNTGPKPGSRANCYLAINGALRGVLRGVLKCFRLCAVVKPKLLLSLFLLIVGYAVAGWQPIPPLLEANGGFACGVVDKKIVVIGGTNWKDETKHWLDGIWVFDPKSQKWEAHGKLPHPLAYAVAADWNGVLIIAGGTDGKEPRKDVWRIQPSLEPRRIGKLNDDAVIAVGSMVGEDLFLLGGCADPSALTGLHGRGVRLNLGRGDTSPLQPPGSVPFALAASAVVGRELFVFGGVTPAPTNEIANLTDAWALDAGKDKWRSLNPFPIAVRGASAVKLDKHRILIAGGYGGQPEGFTAAAFIYDTKRDAYAKTLDLPVAALVGLVRAGDFVYALGGEDRGKHRTDACFRVKVAELLKVAKGEQNIKSGTGTK